MDFQSILLAMWPQLHYEIRGIGHRMRQGCREEKEWHKEIRGIERKSTSSTLRSASTAPTAKLVSKLEDLSLKKLNSKLLR